MILVHEDPALFREAAGITQLGTGFAGRLIEKDYFCSVLLEYLSAVETALVFKGGTCLAKVYAEFYRLSEDLDFVIPMAAGAMRAERSKRTAGLKKAVAELSDHSLIRNSSRFCARRILRNSIWIGHLRSCPELPPECAD